MTSRKGRATILLADKGMQKNFRKVMKQVTAKEEQIITRINAYAEEVLADIDPQKTLISTQLEKLRPIMEQIAKEEKMELTDLFILYMDLASELSVSREDQFESEFLTDFNNPRDTTDFRF